MDTRRSTNNSMKEIAQDVGYDFKEMQKKLENRSTSDAIEADFKIGQTWKDTH